VSKPRFKKGDRVLVKLEMSEGQRWAYQVPGEPISATYDVFDDEDELLSHRVIPDEPIKSAHGGPPLVALWLHDGEITGAGS
jgi:hypothetical protein